MEPAVEEGFCGIQDVVRFDFLQQLHLLVQERLSAQQWVLAHVQV
jgi:hypothetical protein